MRPWKDCRDLLNLFGIPESAGSSAFVDLCELGALLRWSGSVHRLSDLERGLMKEYRVSPLIFWSNQKRAVRPLLAAGGDTLRALGLPVEAEPRSVHELAEAVAEVLAEDMGPRDYASPLMITARGFDDRLRELGL